MPYSIAEFLAEDYPPFFRRHPELSSLGGNTNGVNTFTGLDMGNLTGGVINGQNLLDGDNFICFVSVTGYIGKPSNADSGIALPCATDRPGEQAPECCGR